MDGKGRLLDIEKYTNVKNLGLNRSMRIFLKCGPNLMSSGCFAGYIPGISSYQPKKLDIGDIKFQFVTTLPEDIIKAWLRVLRGVRCIKKGVKINIRISTIKDITPSYCLYGYEAKVSPKRNLKTISVTIPFENYKTTRQLYIAASLIRMVGEFKRMVFCILKTLRKDPNTSFIQAFMLHCTTTSNHLPIRLGNLYMNPSSRAGVNSFPLYCFIRDIQGLSYSSMSKGEKSIRIKLDSVAYKEVKKAAMTSEKHCDFLEKIKPFLETRSKTKEK